MGVSFMIYRVLHFVISINHSYAGALSEAKFTVHTHTIRTSPKTCIHTVVPTSKT